MDLSFAKDKQGRFKAVGIIAETFEEQRIVRALCELFIYGGEGELRIEDPSIQNEFGDLDDDELVARMVTFRMQPEVQ